MRAYQEPSAHAAPKRYRDTHDAHIMAPVHDAKRCRTNDDALLHQPSRIDVPAQQRDNYQLIRSTHGPLPVHSHYDGRPLDKHPRDRECENPRNGHQADVHPHPDDAYRPLPSQMRHHGFVGDHPPHVHAYDDPRAYGGHVPPPRAGLHTYHEPHSQPRDRTVAPADRSCAQHVQYVEEHLHAPSRVAQQAIRQNVVEEYQRHQAVYKQLPHPRASPRETQQPLYAARQYPVIEEDRGRSLAYEQVPHTRASPREQQQHLQPIRQHSVIEENRARYRECEQLPYPAVLSQDIRGSHLHTARQHSVVEEDRGRRTEYQRSHHPRASPPEPRHHQQPPVQTVRQHAVVEEISERRLAFQQMPDPRAPPQRTPREHVPQNIRHQSVVDQNRARASEYQQLPDPRAPPQRTPREHIPQNIRQQSFVDQNSARHAVYQQLPHPHASPQRAHQQVDQASRHQSIVDPNSSRHPVYQDVPHPRASPPESLQRHTHTARHQSVASQNNARHPVYQELLHSRASPPESQPRHLHNARHQSVAYQSSARSAVYQQLPPPRVSAPESQQRHPHNARHQSVADQNSVRHSVYQELHHSRVSPPEVRQHQPRITRHRSMVNECRERLSAQQRLPGPRASPQDVLQNSKTNRHRSMADENRGRFAVHQQQRDSVSGTSTGFLNKMIQESVRNAKQHPGADTIATKYVRSQQTQHHKHQKEESQAQCNATQHNRHKLSKQQKHGDENLTTCNSEKVKPLEKMTVHKDKTSANAKQSSKHKVRACATEIAATRGRTQQAERHVDVGPEPQTSEHEKLMTQRTRSTSARLGASTQCQTSMPTDRSRHGSVKARRVMNGKQSRRDPTVFNATTLVKALTGSSPGMTQAITHAAEDQNGTVKKEVDLHVCGDFERSTNKERETQYNVYRSLIIRGLRARMLPADTFLAYTKLKPSLQSARKSRVQWMIDMGYNFRVEQETLHMAVQISDRFIARTNFQTDTDIMLCIAGCMMVAIKFNESRRSDPSVADYISYTKNFSDTKSLYSLERRLLRELDFSVISVTVATFITFFIEGSGAKHKGKLYWLSSFFADLTMFEIDMLVVPPDKLAAASLHAAIEYCMPNEKQTATYWERHIEAVTNFKDAEVSVAAKCLRTMAKSYSNSHLAKKYARENYGAVSQYLWTTTNVTAFTSPPVAETEYPHTGPTPRAGFHR